VLCLLRCQPGALLLTPKVLSTPPLLACAAPPPPTRTVALGNTQAVL
jgi:hypothetical protein